MRADPSIAFSLKDAAILRQQLQVVSQPVFLNIVELIEDNGVICRWLVDFLLEDLVDKGSHVELTFGSVDEMTSSQSFVLSDKSFSVVATAFVSNQPSVLHQNGRSSARKVSLHFSLFRGLYQPRNSRLRQLPLLQRNNPVLMGWNAQDQQLLAILSEILQRIPVLQCIYNCLSSPVFGYLLRIHNLSGGLDALEVYDLLRKKVEVQRILLHIIITRDNL